MENIPERELVLLNQDVNASMLTCESAWAGFCDPALVTHMGAAPVMYGEIIKGDTINWYMEPELMQTLITSARASLLSNKDFLQIVTHGTEAAAAKIIAHTRSALPELADSAPGTHAPILEESAQLYREISFYGSAIAFADIDGGVTERNLGTLRAKLGENAPNLRSYLNLLSSPDAPSMSERAVSALAAGMSDEQALDEYFWLNQGYAGRGLAGEDLSLIKSSFSAEKNSPRLPEIDLTDEEAQSFFVAKSLVYLKSLRADVRQFLNVLTNRIADRYAAYWNIGAPVISTMTFNELISHIQRDTRPDASIEARVAHSLFARAGDGYRIWTGEEADAVLAGKLLQHAGEGDSVTGQVAQGGTVRGPVRLVFNSNHNDKVRQGDVLVAIATSPQFLPAMARASAFVTDIGGITSHAAIVARELGKPCIVGTRVATQIFKDGDTVEVDAEKGIVRKI